MKKTPILLIVGMCWIFFQVIGSLPVIGSLDSPAARNVSPRYIEKSHEEAGSPNFVTAVLADYRGFDTLGETSVIFTAGAATVLLLKLFKEEKE